MYSERKEITMSTYNGYKSWNAWNVSLWINNDEYLYRLAVECVKATSSLRYAAHKFLSEVGRKTTPDGAKYNVSSVMEAMEGYKK